MKKVLLTLGFIAAAVGVFAQENVTGTAIGKARERATYSRDFLMIQISYDGWAQAPDSARTKGLSRGFNFALMYDMPIGKSKMSLAGGLGVSTSSIFLDDQRLDMTNGSSNKVNFVHTEAYRKYKVATTYLEIPLEIRYRQVPNNANTGFKAALGVKAGALVNAHTKAKNSFGGEKNIIKEQNRRFFNPWRFAATARIGYGNLGIFGAVNLNPLFKENTDAEVRPYSIGIALSGL